MSGPEPPESQSSNASLKHSCQSLRVNWFIILHGEGLHIKIIYTSSLQNKYHEGKGQHLPFFSLLGLSLQWQQLFTNLRWSFWYFTAQLLVLFSFSLCNKNDDILFPLLSPLYLHHPTFYRPYNGSFHQELLSPHVFIFKWIIINGLS